MAKIKYTEQYVSLYDFEGETELHVNKKGTQAIWSAVDSEVTMTVRGKGFEVSDANEDFLGKGKINSIEIEDGDGKLILSISDLNIKATKLVSAFENNGSDGLFQYISWGDDVVTGSRVADFLVGSRGDDIMSGKGGADVFVFLSESSTSKGAHVEHDVITDFDVRGDDADTLSIGQDYTLKAAHHGQDTMVLFDDGSTVLLEHVTKTQMQHYLESMG